MMATSTLYMATWHVAACRAAEDQRRSMLAAVLMPEARERCALCLAFLALLDFTLPGFALLLLYLGLLVFFGDLYNSSNYFCLALLSYLQQ